MNQMEYICGLGVDKGHQFVMFTLVSQCGLEKPVAFSGMVRITRLMWVYALMCTHKDTYNQKGKKGGGHPDTGKIHDQR